MKYKILLIALFFSFCSFASEQKNILILNSYHSGLSWTDSIVKSIKNELSDLSNCVIHIEDMDSKRRYSSEHFQLLKEYYKRKYTDTKIDLIISTDDNAYSFLIKNKKELFGDIPSLFCGVNNVHIPPKGYNGVFENPYLKKTLEIILKNHPDYSKIVFVADYSRTGDSTIKELKSRLDKLPEYTKYEIFRAHTIKELQTKLSKLDPNSIVLYLLFNRDSNGNYYTYSNGFNLVKNYCSVPIYCIWDFYLSKGVIGGAIITGKQQGKQVALMAKKVLAGISIDQLKPILSKHEYTFDYHELAKFGIPIDQLPKESIIINSPYSFVKENKILAFLTFTVILLLVIIIVVMGINNHLRKSKIAKEKLHLIEIKANNAELEKAIQIAEESNRLKSAFLANMSHEIRTPMNSILGFTELLSTDNLENEKKKKFIQIIQKNANSLLCIISDILDISKIETNQLNIVKQKCNLNELFETIEENYNSLKEKYEDHELDFRIQIPEANYNINTDPIRLLQIFNNLIENALKFTNKGKIEIGYQIKDKSVVFFVSDTGIGISEAEQQIIFDRFRQAEIDTNSRKYSGTGLGLAICKSLVELLGGSIRIQSKLNKGTTFYFTHPF